MAKRTVGKRRGLGYRLQFFKRPWFRTWLSMTVLAVLMSVVMLTTDNEAVVPAALFYGAAAAPLAFAMATHTRTGFATSVPPSVLLGMFLFGGGISLALGGFFDAEFIRDLNSPEILVVGFIEELAKFLPVLAMALTGRYLAVRSGVALGFATALGFAVLESMSYGLQAALSDGITAAEGTLIGRGLTEPFGHLAWTGLLCALAFTSWQKRGKVTLTAGLVGGYLLVALLHSANDGLLTYESENPVLFLGYLAVAVTSYVLFRLGTRSLTLPTAAAQPQPRPA
ncbi:PrsW family intramembrane metalloprotease [Streptomyces spinosisporus]|uniref:PrsW family intramembrane metalloprotease n=1 Tax=Streptomyces spinosisporus TaxID=2927582 RepID=A0ABS9X9H1_9ACTN|nr:PrsW family glutamic-type intramembrane protease [Streptomyces spinosisporus]MCI3238714.1 PrsW family intramembrane metalloprotease [Streptomyces spinosisporus]